MTNNTIETASEFFDDTIFVFDESRDYVIRQMVAYHSHLMAEAEKEVSDEKIESEFPSTYGQIVNEKREYLNVEYLERNDIDFFENYAKQEGARFIRSKIFVK